MLISGNVIGSSVAAAGGGSNVSNVYNVAA